MARPRPDRDYDMEGEVAPEGARRRSRASAVKVHYRSRFARWALPRKYVAVTLWDHVFTRLEHLEESILRHEEVHVRQWKRHGLVRFAFLYTWFHFRYGYCRNPFEVEARSEETPR